MTEIIFHLKRLLKKLCYCKGADVTQIAIFGSFNYKENFSIINHLLLIFKFYTYNCRSTCKLNIEQLKIIIYKTTNIELEVSKTATIKKQKYIIKWQPIPIT